MNVIMTEAAGGFIEVQSTAESEPYTRANLDSMLALAKGIAKLIDTQKAALKAS